MPACRLSTSRPGRSRRKYLASCNTPRRYHNAPCPTLLTLMDEPAGCDPATWNLSATTETAIDVLEPLPQWPEGSEFRQACVQLLALLEGCSDHLRRGHRPPPLEFVEIEIALGMRADRDRSVTSIAEEYGTTKQNVSAGVTRFLRSVQLPPSWACKPENARISYQESNGHSWTHRT
jgi:hypothetical protein